MTSHLKRLIEKKLANPPKWLPDNVQYETIMGSHAYGVATDNSDFDVYGFAIPLIADVFPHLRGEIPGFGTQKRRFEQYEQHKIHDPTLLGNRGREYDFNIYSIVKYFQLVMNNNPNMIDSLFTPVDCILHITEVGQLVRDKRHIFLSTRAWHSFRGYAHSQIANIEKQREGRKNLVEKYGYDTKFAYHTVRLILEVEQILTEGTLDLRRNSDLLRTIRDGGWSVKRVQEWFDEKEKALEPLYHSKVVPYRPDEEQIKALLLNCLEHHYGSLSNIIVFNNTTSLISDIENVLLRYR